MNWPDFSIRWISRNLMKTGSTAHRFGLVLILAFASILPVQGAQLTGVFAFSTDEGGNPAGDFVWDTRGPESDFYKIFVASGGIGDDPDGLTNSFINGPTWALAPVDV